MKNYATWTLGILMLCAGIRVHATDYVAFDGQWWQELPSIVRATAVEGMMAGIRRSCMTILIYEGFLKTRPGKRDLTNLESHQWMARAAAIATRKQDQCNFSHNFGFYRRRITSFYSEWPRNSGVSPADVLACLNDANLATNRSERCEDHLDKSPKK